MARKKNENVSDVDIMDLVKLEETPQEEPKIEVPELKTEEEVKEEIPTSISVDEIKEELKKVINTELKFVPPGHAPYHMRCMCISTVCLSGTKAGMYTRGQYVEFEAGEYIPWQFQPTE